MEEDTKLVCRAIRENWPITPEIQAKCVARLEAALDDSLNARDIARIVTAIAKLHGQNVQAALSQKYIDAVGESVQVRPLHEEIRLMISSLPIMPEESNVSEAHHIEKPEEPWPNPPIPLLPPSCSRDE